MLDRILEIKEISKRGIQMIKILINDKRDEYQKIGSKWLLEILCQISLKKTVFKGKERITKLIKSLSESPNTHTRLCFIQIIKQLTNFYKSLFFKSHGSTKKIAMVYKIITDMLMMCVKKKESNPQILRIMLTMIIKMTGYKLSRPTDPIDHGDIFSEVISGERQISEKLLLKNFSPNLFKLIIKNLPATLENHNPRYCALILLSHFSKNGGISKIGDIYWFEPLLKDPDLLIANLTAEICENHWKNEDYTKYIEWKTHVKTNQKKEGKIDMALIPVFRVQSIIDLIKSEKNKFSFFIIFLGFFTLYFIKSNYLE